jgi:hypothetical protein
MRSSIPQLDSVDTEEEQDESHVSVNASVHSLDDSVEFEDRVATLVD